MAKQTNQRLREEIEHLQDIVNLILNSWKSKHPEDFEVPDGMKLCVGTKEMAKNELI